MISKSQLKHIHSLEQKKMRRKEMAFVAEGPKVVGDLMRRFKPHAVFATQEWIQSHSIDNVQEITDDELRKISFLQHPQQVLAIFPIPNQEQKAADIDCSKLYLALDGVQDPGNLGTIIRIADWFGIDTIFCSLDTADAYNPKVIQATMGSIAHVNVVYVDLKSFLTGLPESFPLYGTLLDGENIYEKPLSENGIIIMGNEGNGISQDIRKLITDRLLIPNFSEGDSAESLNVSIATAITCSEFKRRKR